MGLSLVAIRIQGVPLEKIEELTAPERAIIGRWKTDGQLDVGYVRTDMGGAYLVMRAGNEDLLRTQLRELPMFPYMQLEITEIRNMLG